MTLNDQVFPERMQGIRIHRPGAIAAYLVLGGPIGLFLYGENLSKRGHSTFGLFIRLISVVGLLGVTYVSAAGQRVGSVGVIGVLLAIWLYKKEVNLFQRDLSQGAIPARWWPPLLAVIAGGVIIVLLQAAFFPES